MFFFKKVFLWNTLLQSDPTHLWPLGHLIRGMRRQTYPPTYLPTYLPPLEQQDTHQEPPDNRQEPGDFYFWHTMSDPRDLSPLRHLIRVMRRHDLTKKFYLPTYLPVHLPQSTPSRCDSRDLWPLWHLFRVMRRPDQKKDNDKDTDKDNDKDKDI